MQLGIRPFGSSERPFTENERKEIKAYMLNGSLSSPESKTQVQMIGYETDFFRNTMKLIGAGSSLSFFFGPVIRRQPIFLRYIGLHINGLLDIDLFFWVAGF